MKKALIIFTILLISILPLASAATIIVSTYHLGMPTYSTYFNFLSDQTVESIERTSYSNATFPEYWFVTKTNGEIFGFSSTTNFTIIDFKTTNTLSIGAESAGFIYIYCGSLGQPIAISTVTSTFTNELLTLNVLSASTINIVWGATGSGTAPTPEPTATTNPDPIFVFDSGTANSIIIIIVAAIIIVLLLNTLFGNKGKKKLHKGDII